MNLLLRLRQIRKLDIVIVGVLLAFFLSWHYRADVIDVWHAAATANASLTQVCR